MTLAEQITEYIKCQKSVSRADIAKKFKISRYAVDQLALKGLVANMPKLMTPSQAATHGRITGGIKWGDKFHLKGTPKFKGARYE
jgi:ribosomal protein S14